MTRTDARDRLLDQPTEARRAQRDLEARAKAARVFFTREEREKLVALAIGGSK